MGIKDNDKHMLGMSMSTATYKLYRKILFSLIRGAGTDKCHRCGETISEIDELSIEHKNAWRWQPNPKDAYFDINNVAFSHRSCNSAEERERRLARIANGTQPPQAKRRPNGYRNK